MGSQMRGKWNPRVWTCKGSRVQWIVCLDVGLDYFWDPVTKRKRKMQKGNSVLQCRVLLYLLLLENGITSSDNNSTTSSGFTIIDSGKWTGTFPNSHAGADVTSEGAGTPSTTPITSSGATSTHNTISTVSSGGPSTSNVTSAVSSRETDIPHAVSTVNSEGGGTANTMSSWAPGTLANSLSSTSSKGTNTTSNPASILASSKPTMTSNSTSRLPSSRDNSTSTAATVSSRASTTGSGKTSLTDSRVSRPVSTLTHMTSGGADRTANTVPSVTSAGHSTASNTGLSVTSSSWSTQGTHAASGGVSTRDGTPENGVKPSGSLRPWEIFLITLVSVVVVMGLFAGFFFLLRNRLFLRNTSGTAVYCPRGPGLGLGGSHRDPPRPAWSPGWVWRRPVTSVATEMSRR
ncbi:mucin-21 [Perognathus longimembris pacificus]|uniref:mucin-21 n=1 Tax=Perognathus longimembris pacificus TaxID=214514 RepID=UPI002019AD98|nr:mucin-21 [Perognathus longimembris pacificus]